MCKEKNFNILRGVVICSGLDDESKQELLGFITELEEQNDYTDDLK